MSSHSSPEQPVLAFKGLRVLDASQGLAGPYCAMLLAQHGATVVKVEPAQGDWSRGIGKRYGEHTGLSLACNRGKQSVVLDLRRPTAPAALQRIARHCDVVLESFRPGVAARIGLGYEALSSVRPGLIYASVSGYGQSGPRSEDPGTDTVIQAFSGMMSLNPDAQGQPNRIGFLVVDTLTGLHAFQAVSAALYARLSGGPGQRLDISLMQSAAAFLGQKLIEASLATGPVKAINAPAGIYRSRDGWVAIALSNEDHFTAVCNALERPDLRADPRYASFETRADHQAVLQAEVAACLLKRATADWVQRISAAGALANPVNSLEQWSSDPHVQAVQAAPRVSLPGVGDFLWPRIPGVALPEAGDPRARFAGIGEQGGAALTALGLSETEVQALREEGVLVETQGR
ncbi:MAG: CaiB/BaiF CoA transferase family protein [Burkholderiaceae bacterium]